MDTFATTAAQKLMTFSHDAPPHRDLEDYLNPSQTETIYCTTQEREDFENEHELAFTQDVIEDESDYDTFVRHLAEHCNLQRL